MQNLVNRKDDKWIRPWNLKEFSDLYNRDERFFSILIKGVISWLNRNIVMYDEPINHFIFNTGSSYMYVESNGYEFKWSETTGEDQMYMHMPRCVMELTDISIPQEELSNPFSRGTYERRSGDNIKGYNAEIRRLPIELTINLKYVFSNFNESIVVLQELIDKLVFQQYFQITYLGQIIECSIEFPANNTPQLNKIDMTSTDTNQKNLTFDIKICSNYPIVNTKSEIGTDKIIKHFGGIFDQNGNVVVLDGQHKPYHILIDGKEYELMNDENGWYYVIDGIKYYVTLVENGIFLHDIDPNDPASKITDKEKYILNI